MKVILCSIAIGAMLLPMAEAMGQGFGFDHSSYRIIKEIESTVCYVLPDYSKSDFERVQTASGYDLIQFSYSYQERKEVLLVLEERWTRRIVKETYPVSKMLTENFEISERQGNEFNLNKQVSRFITRKGKFLCKE